MAYDDTLIIPYVGKPNDDTYYNTLARNIDYLKTGQVVSYNHTSGSPASFTTTSTPAFAVIDALFTLDITTYGLPVTAGFSGNFSATGSNQGMALDIKHKYLIGGVEYIDPLDPDDNNTAGLAPIMVFGKVPLCVVKHYQNLPAGTHRFKFIWRMNGSATLLTLDGVTKPMSWVYEGL